MNTQAHAPQAATRTNAPARTRHPGLTVNEALSEEIGKLLRAGYHQNGDGNKAAVLVLQEMKLGKYTAARVWAEAVAERTNA